MSAGHVHNRSNVARFAPWFFSILVGFTLIAFWPGYIAVPKSSSSFLHHFHAATGAAWLGLLIAQDKRWVVVAPPGSRGTSLLLARASTPEQERFVGNQAGGRVFLFLSTDDFWRDYDAMVSRGVRFVRPPSEKPYGVVAVFEDLYGNRWDLVQYALERPRVARHESARG
jgi:hypothetical protein